MAFSAVLVKTFIGPPVTTAPVNTPTAPVAGDLGFGHVDSSGNQDVGGLCVMDITATGAGAADTLVITKPTALLGFPQELGYEITVTPKTAGAITGGLLVTEAAGSITLTSTGNAGAAAVWRVVIKAFNSAPVTN